ncbi:MAG TPA: peptidoglycan-binding protein [Nitrososphaera sp.]|nr:peptidoglycan-binding protein [Nitrososphaera sp.]
MRSFENKTFNENELGIRRGKRVPEDGVNLAYAKAPKFTPAENIVIVDTSQIVEENQVDLSSSKKIYYANSLGVLEDENGNQLIDDEYPFVTDVFSVDEDWSTVPGSEYKAEDILPFVHTSRYFHIDFAGLTMGSGYIEPRIGAIKVVNSRGGLYVDGNGRPKYKIHIAAARMMASLPEYLDQWCYRVFAYVDTDTPLEELYLVYNKVELTNQSTFKNQVINYKERINPQPVFEYRPEESEIIEFANRERKWYSSKPLTLREQVLGVPHSNVEGYKIFVPKKAINDPRIFQLFHWRLTCNFTQQYTIDEQTLTTSSTTRAIKCGVVVTPEHPKSQAPYCFLNIMRSAYNLAKIRFINPLKELFFDATPNSSSDEEQENADYWHVDLDTISMDELKKFDILVWAPTNSTVNLANYQSKIDYFTNNLKGTFMMDTSSYTVPTNFGPVTTAGVTVSTGAPVTSQGSQISSNSSTVVVDTGHQLISGKNTLGGWNITQDKVNSLSYIPKLFDPGFTQFIESIPGDYKKIIEVQKDLTTKVPVTIQKDVTGGGRIIFSTFPHAFSVSALFEFAVDALLSSNLGDKLFKTDKYKQCINSPSNEGAMKFFYNTCLQSVKSKDLVTVTQTVVSQSVEKDYSTSWAYSTDWKSSWVIDGDALSEHERARYDFALLPRDPLATTPALDLVWKRRLSNKTCKELIDELLLADPVLKHRVAGSVREYKLEITNGTVHSDTTVVGETPPYAYTEEFSPQFRIPAELGPNAIREEEVKGNYSTGQYQHRVYPPKPYAGHVRASWSTSTDSFETNNTNWVATGTAIETKTITNTVPPSSTTRDSEIRLTWWDNSIRNRNMPPNNWLYPRFLTPKTDGLDMWTEDNYYTTDWGNGHLNWPYWGHNGRYLQGSSGGAVSFIQEALNRFHNATFFNSGVGLLAVDGQYGPKTATAVTNFQSTFRARYVDGVVDAETWSIIGYQIIRGGWRDGIFGWAYGNIVQSHASDGNRGTAYAKRSWVSGGPPVVWEMFQIAFNQTYNIHAVTVIPHVVGQTPTMMVRSVCVRNHANLTGFNSEWSQLKYLPYRPNNGQELRIDFGPYTGNAVVIGVGQDGPAGGELGSARFLGVQDIWAHARVSTTTTTPGSTKISKQTRQIAITASGSADITSFQDKVIQAVPRYTGTGSLSEITWTGVTSSNPKVAAGITSAGKITLRSTVVNTETSTGFTGGPTIPGGTYYSMDEDGRINPRPEQGTISKADGIKLLCDATGKPYGFPTLPTDTGATETQRQYGKLSFIGNGNDSTVFIGFYDKARKEFITSKGGFPEMPYIDWMNRGPDNVYIGVITTYELTSQKLIPTDDDAPKLPQRWAMPVYGVYKKKGAHIALEPLSPNLGPRDLWPVAVRNGRFSRDVTIRPKVNGYLTNYLKDYQGTTIRAFYGLPEVDLGGWSSIYGPPNADIKDEEPLILDDRSIQVRQAPILMIKEPTQFPSIADPVRPVLKVYRRASINDPWVQLTWPEIEDYNVITGEIILRNPLETDDPALVKVSYTSVRRVFHFKKYGSTLLNLNPYPGHTRDMIGQAMYIYILPEYVKDTQGNVIADSVVDKALHFSREANIFDPIRPEYNPLAVQLGVIFISTALDVNDVVLMDTRRRGGGAMDSANAAEVIRLVQEASSYWDINYGSGTAYQKGGFVVIRLPVELKEEGLTETDIVDAIERNITAGVRFKIEDLNGNDW